MLVDVVTSRYAIESKSERHSESRHFFESQIAVAAYSLGEELWGASLALMLHG